MDQNPQMPSIMMREMASGGHNLPKVALEDFFRIMGIVKDILDRGQKEGLFTESIPVLVHMMVVGTLAIYKMSNPIRSKYEGLPEEIRKLDDRVSGQIAAHLAEMMIKALKQTDQVESNP
jgi:hypothetical protein